MSPSATITVQPGSLMLRTRSGSCAAVALQEAGIDVGASCSLAGTCGKCAVRFVTRIPPPTPEDLHHLKEEQLAEGWRLACRHQIDQDTELVVPGVRAASRRPTTKHRPAAGSGLAGLQDATWRGRRFVRTLPLVSTFAGDAEPSVGSGDPASIGIALDVGTTMLSGYLIDLRTRSILARATTANPQRCWGADVLSRIDSVQRGGHAQALRLRSLVLQGAQELIDELLRQTSGQAERQVAHGVIVGNPTMVHLLLGFDPTSLGRTPFVPSFPSRLISSASQLGMPALSGCRMDVLPLVSSFVGADTVAALLVTQLGDTPEPAALLDLGTNGEIVVWNGESLLAASAAAGPAFEAASISCGMAASAGAIDRMWIEGDALRYSAVEDSEPRGVCGSGLIDAVSCLRLLGRVSASGRVEAPSRDAVKLAPRVWLSQDDIRQFQLAKAAVRAGLDTVLSHAGLRPRDLRRLYIGGAFGDSLRWESVVEVGLLPLSVAPASVISAGNIACRGAAEAVGQEHRLREADRLANACTTIDLSQDPDFREGFVRQMRLEAS